MKQTFYKIRQDEIWFYEIKQDGRLPISETATAAMCKLISVGLIVSDGFHLEITKSPTVASCSNG